MSTPSKLAQTLHYSEGLRRGQVRIPKSNLQTLIMIEGPKGGRSKRRVVSVAVSRKKKVAVDAIKRAPCGVFP